MFQMRGGYTIANREGLAKLSTALESCDDHDSLRDLIRVGVHSDVQVTSHGWGTKLIPPLPPKTSAASASSGTESPSAGAAASASASTSEDEARVHMVTQVFCSAVACNYNKTTLRNDWMVSRQHAYLTTHIENSVCISTFTTMFQPSNPNPNRHYAHIIADGSNRS